MGLNGLSKEYILMSIKPHYADLIYTERKRSAACVHTAYRTPMFATNVIDRRTPRFNICASGAERNMPLKPDMAIHVAIGRDGRERYRHLRRAWRR